MIDLITTEEYPVPVSINKRRREKPMKNCHICGRENTDKDEYCFNCNQKIKFTSPVAKEYYRYRSGNFLRKLREEWYTINTIFYPFGSHYTGLLRLDYLYFIKILNKTPGHFILPVNVLIDSLIYRFEVTDGLEPLERWLAMFGLTGPACVYIVNLTEKILGYSILPVTALVTSLIYGCAPLINYKINRETLDKVREKLGSERAEDLENCRYLDIIFYFKKVNMGLIDPFRYELITNKIRQEAGEEKLKYLENLIDEADKREYYNEYDLHELMELQRLLTINQVKENLGEEKFKDLLYFLDLIEWEDTFYYDELFKSYFISLNLSDEEINIISDSMMKIDSLLRDVTLTIYKKPSSMDKKGEKKIIYEKHIEFIPKYCTDNTDYLLSNLVHPDLPDLPVGLYTIEISDSVSKSASSFCLSDIEIVAIQSDKSFLFMACNKYTGKILDDVDFYFIDGMEEKVIQSKDSIVKIIWEELEDSPEKVHILACRGDSEAELSVSRYRYKRDEKTLKGYIYTDRPVYRSGHKVNFKGILRKGKDLNYIEGEDIKVHIKDSKNKEIYSKILQTDEYGTISDSLNLPDLCPSGRYNINVTDSNSYSDSIYFNVSEYRKPEFYVKIDTDRPFYIPGEPITVTVEGFYYFGKPLTRGTLDYEVKKNTYSSKECYGKINTDEHGKGIFSWTVPDEQISKKYYYNVKIKLSDEYGREIEQYKYIYIYPSHYTLSLTVDKIQYELGETSYYEDGYKYIPVAVNRYYIKKGDILPLKVKAKDHSGKPVETEITVSIKNELSEEVERKILTTGKDGCAPWEYMFVKTGTYKLESYSSKDSNVRTTGTIYCYSPEDYSSDIKIFTDEKKTGTGDRLNVLVMFPSSSSGKALVTVEGHDILYYVIDMGETKLLDFSLDIDESYRDGFYTGVYYPYSGGVRFVGKKIVTVRKDKYLTLSAESDKEEYLPREYAKFIIKTSDNKDKPVTSQVTMGIIDSSIYAVNEGTREDIQSFFFKSKKEIDNISHHVKQSPNLISSMRFEKKDYYRKVIETIMNFVKWKYKWGERGAECACQALCDEEVSQSLKKPDFTREDFLDTVYFNPNIITDNNGIAEVTVPLPDNLTTWRATLLGITKDTMAGENSKNITVTKKLFARIITPRFLRERDETAIAGVIYNYLSSEKTVTGKLITEGPVELSDRSDYKINISSGNTGTVIWNIKITGAGSCTLKLSALTDEESDELKITLPVLPHGCEKTVSISDTTDSKIEETLLIPGEADLSSSRCLILLTPSIASSILSSIEYLVGFPYGCVEQTMSRFLPNVIVSKAFEELHLCDDFIGNNVKAPEKIENKYGGLLKDLPDMVRAGLERLYSYHHSDGGWGWWQYDKSLSSMTAYVVYGLSLAEKAGYQVDTYKINSAIKWMEKHYEKEYNLSLKAFMVYASIISGKVHEVSRIKFRHTTDVPDTFPGAQLKEVFDKRDELDNYAKALLALALEKSNLSEEAEELAELIEKSAEIREPEAWWNGKSGSYGWTDSMIETTAYCLKALLAIKKESPLIEKVVRFLSAHRKGNRWNSTKDTAAVLMTFTDYLKHSGELNSNFISEVFLNGKELKSVGFKEEDIGKEGKRLLVTCQEGLKEGENKITFNIKGHGRLYHSTSLTYYTKEEEIKASSCGFDIVRNYFVCNGENDYLFIASPEYPVYNVNLYDTIRVQLKIKGKPEYEYVIIEDPKPAGCEILEKKGYFYRWGEKYTQDGREWEVKDDRVAFFFSEWYEEACEINYYIKVETMGTFHVMPARAGLMYNPEINGISDEIIIKTPFSYTGKVKEFFRKIL